jgi:hypothetical protein
MCCDGPRRAAIVHQLHRLLPYGGPFRLAWRIRVLCEHGACHCGGAGDPCPDCNSTADVNWADNHCGGVLMTPEEAANFCEDDEDPREVFARFDAGPHVVTGQAWYEAGGTLPLALTAVRNGTGTAERVRRGLDYIKATYGPGASQ